MRHFCLVHIPVLLWTLCLPMYHCSLANGHCISAGGQGYSSGSWKCPKTVSHPAVLKRPRRWSETTGIYPYFIHSIPQLVLPYWLKTFWKTVPINMFYKTFKTHLPYRKHIFSKTTYLIACIAYLKDSKSHSLCWYCNFHLLCRRNLKERWPNQYFQSTLKADFTKVFLIFYSTSLVWSRKRFRVSTENVSGISKEEAVTSISISVLLAAVRAAKRLKACRATTVSCQEKQTLLYWKEAASAPHRPCFGDLVVSALTHLWTMLESSCSHLRISEFPWHEDPSPEERVTQEVSYCGNEKWGGSQPKTFFSCARYVQHLISWKTQQHNSQNYTSTMEKDTEESNNIAIF